MKDRNTIKFRRLPVFVTNWGEKHQKIQVTNLSIPNGCNVFLSNELRNCHPYSYYAWGKYLKAFKSEINYKNAIMLYKGDANLRVLLHEIGHFLDYGNDGEEGNAADDEITADKYGSEYYKKCTGKGIRLRDGKGFDCWGKACLVEILTKGVSHE